MHRIHFTLVPKYSAHWPPICRRLLVLPTMTDAGCHDDRCKGPPGLLSEPDPRGAAELRLLGLPVGDAAEEQADSTLNDDYDMYEVGGTDKLRLLDDFALYTEDGSPVPLECLDQVKVRHRNDI